MYIFRYDNGNNLSLQIRTPIDLLVSSAIWCKNCSILTGSQREVVTQNRGN